METLPDQPLTPLTPLYYRDNFLRLCATVQSQYGDILSSDENHYLRTFHAASINAQCLYIRLISRTGPLFRTSKLSYPEIQDVPAALQELLKSALVFELDVLDIEDLATLYTRSELEQMFGEQLTGLKKLKAKTELIGAISELALSDEQAASSRERVDSGAVVFPTGEEIVALLQLLFFGNRHQSLTQFVLEDLGVTKFYPYALHPEHRLFSCRAAVEEYLACAALADARHEHMENGELEVLPELASSMLQFDMQFESTRPRWDKLCNRLARDLERLEDWERALALYARSESHPARERSARILERTQQWQKADDLCETILQAPQNEAEREAAQKIKPRVLKRLTGNSAKRPRDNFTEVHLTIANGEQSVELLTATHLQRHWHSVHYVENSLMNALFGLAFWPIIFADEPGVFHHPFQRSPTDMYDGNFQKKREQAISDRLLVLENADLSRLIIESFRDNFPYQNSWVDWRFIDEQLIEQATKVIPREHLLAIWKRLLFDPRENRTGFPDLITLGECSGDYALVEVKGPGDALQDNQKRWLRFFQANDIPAEVAWISWLTEDASNTTASVN